jgi:hypothetical protein
MDPASDATEEYSASTPALAGSLREIRPPMDHTPTPLLKQTGPKQPQRRLHQNLKVLGGQNGDRNHVVFMELANRWMDVKGHMEAHMLCEQRPSANSDEGR